MMSKSNRKKNLRYLGVGALAAACLAIGQSGVSEPEVAQALDKPTQSTSNETPAGFLPAPNEVPYCDSMEYFNFFPSNLAAIQQRTNVQIPLNQSDTAWTNPDGTGIGMKFTTTQESSTVNGFVDAPSGRVPTPMVSYGKPDVNKGLASIGIIMNGSKGTEEDGDKTAAANVELTEPLFYSQWVFTDMDQKFEGFDLKPGWVSTDARYQRYGMFGADNKTANDLPFGWETFTYFGPQKDYPADPKDALPGQINASTPTHAGFFAKAPGNLDGKDKASRFQVDFYGPIDSVEMTRFGDGGSGFATGAGCPPIGLAKEATVPVWDPATQRFNVRYTIRVYNNLPSQATLNERVAAAAKAAFQNNIVGGEAVAIDQEKLQITDALNTDGFLTPEIKKVTASSNLTVNLGYNGVSDVNLLSGTDTLLAGANGEVIVDVAYPPDFKNAGWKDCSFATTNQATVTATAAGVLVTDLSDNGNDPKPAATNGDSGTDDPTPVAFGPINCTIGLAKRVLPNADGVTNVNNGDGTYTVNYEFNVGNYGAVNMTNFQLNDDLAKAYGTGFVSATTKSDQCNGLNASGGLAPTQFCKIVLEVVFKPVDGILEPWINQASITATVGPDPTATVTKSDESQNGQNPDPDGDGDPTNNTEPTPNQIGALIGLNKLVTAGPTWNGDGTYNVTYKLVATNFGFAYLDNIRVNDDLKATFGDALIDYKSDDKCATAVLPKKGDTCEVTVEVKFRPNAQVRWENSADVTGNAGGTDVTDVSQNGVNPDPDGDGNPGNNSDPTPVDVGVADLALRKTSSEGSSTIVPVGGSHIFNIEVFNQGDLYASNIELIDYLPDQMALNDSAWIDNGNKTASYTIAGPIAPGKSVVVPITVTVVGSNVQTLDNNAEIAAFVPVDKDGKPASINGAAPKDIDSTPDKILGNDATINNAIDLTPATGDEDDEDIESITLATIQPPIVTTTTTSTTVAPPHPITPPTGGNFTPMVLLGTSLTAAGFLLISLRRNVPAATRGRLSQ